MDAAVDQQPLYACKVVVAVCRRMRCCCYGCCSRASWFRFSCSPCCLTWWFLRFLQKANLFLVFLFGLRQLPLSVSFEISSLVSTRALVVAPRLARNPVCFSCGVVKTSTRRLGIRPAFSSGCSSTGVGATISGFACCPSTRVFKKRHLA